MKQVGAHRLTLQSERRCSLHGSGRVRYRMFRTHISIAFMQT